MYMTDRDLMYKTNMLVTSLNKNYLGWLSCVTDKPEYSKESDKFNHGFGFFNGSKYYRIEASSKTGCFEIIDQKNCTLYKTAHKKKHLWGYVVKNDSGKYQKGDILNNTKTKIVGNILDGKDVNVGMPDSHYPNYSQTWASPVSW